MKSYRKLTLSVLFASLAIIGVQSAHAEAPPPPAVTLDKGQTEKLLESVRTLLNTSSAAKQIAEANNPKANTERDRALELWSNAKAAFDGGDLAQANKLSTESRKVFIGAVRFAAPEKITAEKQRQDFQNRRDSVMALLDAQKRVSQEKGGVDGAAQAAKDIEKRIGEADQLAAVGKYVDAKVLADQAYLLAKASVNQMRSGDTLVRSLNFKDKAEEYKYELDRNDSLQMLYKVLIEQKGAPSDMVLGQVAKAKELRLTAEGSAANGDHAGAVKQLEDASQQLVRAIRAAGVFIPG